MSAYRALGEGDRHRIRDVVAVFVAEKNWEGCGGLALTDEMRVTIAAQAARLLVGVEHDYFRNVATILVYPSSYRGSPKRGPLGVVTEGVANAGEAWPTGPVILAWDAVARAAFSPHPTGNLVLHEFAHKLDTVDGLIDGTPLLDSRDAYREWGRIMTAEHERLVADARAGRATTLDPYGATDPAEFFAVATESFFENAAALRADRPTLYDLLRRFYRQDPAARGS
jgi:MtfA peptidase